MRTGAGATWVLRSSWPLGAALSRTGTGARLPSPDGVVDRCALATATAAPSAAPAHAPEPHHLNALLAHLSGLGISVAVQVTSGHRAVAATSSARKTAIAKKAVPHKQPPAICPDDAGDELAGVFLSLA